MDEMKQIVKCKFCGSPEYYGAMYWHDGKTRCRKCIYEIWHELNPEWYPDNLDHIYPLYLDGLDHRHDNDKEGDD